MVTVLIVVAILITAFSVYSVIQRKKEEKEKKILDEKWDRYKDNYNQELYRRTRVDPPSTQNVPSSGYQSSKPATDPNPSYGNGTSNNSNDLIIPAIIISTMDDGGSSNSDSGSSHSSSCSSSSCSSNSSSCSSGGSSCGSSCSGGSSCSS